MSDRYLSFVNSTLGKQIAKQVGLPSPSVLERYVEGQSFATGPLLIGTSEGGRLIGEVSQLIAGIDQPVFALQNDRNYGETTLAMTRAGVAFHTWTSSADSKLKAIVFDATGIRTSEELKQLYLFFQPVIKSMQKSGRVVVLGTTPEACTDPREQTAQRSLTGFIKAMGKEMRAGGTANLIYAAPDATDEIASSLQFFLSARSTYVSGQVVKIRKSALSPKGVQLSKPLAGKTALVTGAARGIGEAIARVLARDGAKVVCLDIPQAAEDLAKVAGEVNGAAIELDITAADAPRRIAEHFGADGLDILVHNAGVTRDKTLGNMSEKFWDMVLDINLGSEERINEYLLENKVIPNGGRIICVSSVSGIAGNRGQVNYATSKAGVIGMVDAFNTVLEPKGITINAVAPGFIETAMTAQMPVTIREGGRRLNSMAQGGLPVDVAETIAWYASPASQGVTGNTIRVCGQALIGA